MYILLFIAFFTILIIAEIVVISPNTDNSCLVFPLSVFLDICQFYWSFFRDFCLVDISYCFSAFNFIDSLCFFIISSFLLDLYLFQFFSLSSWGKSLNNWLVTCPLSNISILCHKFSYQYCFSWISKILTCAFIFIEFNVLISLQTSFWPMDYLETR